MAPNVLFLMSDEHRADVAGFAGNGVVRTPNLDRLAQGGVVFDNAYTPSPVCVPARQAIMNGRLPRTSGIEHYGWDLAPGAMTWARRFAQHGYDTVCSGKLHHRGIDQMLGWTRRPFGDIEINPWDVTDPQQPLFDDRQRAVGGKKWSDQKEILRAGVSDAGHIRFDRRATQVACDVLDDHFCSAYYDRERTSKPLLLKLSLNQPHYPYCASEELFQYYLNRVSVYDQEKLIDHPFMAERHVAIEGDLTARDLRRATAAYYAMVEQVDIHIGTVLAQLEQVGQNIDDWIVVYTSDHGEMLGQHGIWEKRTFLEASARVPLIVRYPQTSGHRRVDENVNLCDLFATLCDLADLDLPQGDDGPSDSRSLVPLMQGDTTDWHTRWHNETVSQFQGTNCMVKRDALKYHCYGPEIPDVLYDLEADPSERRNLIGEPRYSSMVQTLRQRAGELGFSYPEVGS